MYDHDLDKNYLFDIVLQIKIILIRLKTLSSFE